LFEYSGACSGCGETPYLKMLTQLFGDRLLIANATGCSSIYGGNLPTTPYTTNREGRGPAWSNSLFEDNAEFGFGFRLALDAHIKAAHGLVELLAPELGDNLVTELLNANQDDEAGIASQRERVKALREKLAGGNSAEARRLDLFADYLVKKSVWLVGGDGWAYDIGYGGLDHVLASRRNVNILVLDTEVYSNTGGQQSKATPLGASAKFAAGGKAIGKKDLGLLANMYGHVYVARVFGAKMAQTAQAFVEAESYDGPSLIIAYSHCIAHGYDMAQGAAQQKLAVESGVWPLYRFDPRRLVKGEPPLNLDYGPPKPKVAEYMRNEARFRVKLSALTRLVSNISSKNLKPRPSAVMRDINSSPKSLCQAGTGRKSQRLEMETVESRNESHDYLLRNSPGASADHRIERADRRSREGQRTRRPGGRGPGAALAR
jgi:pyruvate-ferredoxin/flavodoxin oxidoreductase